MSWRELQLGDGIYVKHGFAFKGEYFSSSGEYMVLTPGNFFEKGGFRVRDGKERFYHADFPEDYLLAEGDLIVAMTEQGEGLLGSAARIPAEGKYLHNQRLGLVQIVKPDLLDKRFLYWVFNSSNVRDQIRATATGAKVKHTAPERIKKVRFMAPELREQQAVTFVLDSYDDLIATNQRRIALLEEAARRLYREWFVHLRFPGHESVPVKDGVPEGWEPCSFADVVEINPKTSVEKGVVRPFVEMAALSESSMVIGERAKRSISGGAKFKNGDTLFARITPCTENGKTGFVQFLEDDTAVASGSTEFLVFRSAKVNPYWVYCISREADFREHAIRSMAGSDGRQRVNSKCFAQFAILKPPIELLQQFANVVEDSFAAIEELCKQNRHLAQARDLLLPKLMSGQLDVSGIPLPDEVAA